MKMRLNKLIALFVAVSLSVSSFAYADDIVDINEASVAVEETAEEAVEETNSNETTEEAGEETSANNASEEADEETSANSVSEEDAAAVSSVDEVNITALENSITAQFLDAESFVYDTDLGLSSVEVAAVLEDTASKLSEAEADKLAQMMLDEAHKLM